MLKALFNQGYSKKFMDRIEFRRKEYFENRRLQTIRENATKMAYNWTHEYPTGTPISYIRDDIIESWERAAKKGIYKDKSMKPIPSHDKGHPAPSALDLQWTGNHGFEAREVANAVAPKKKYKDARRNPPLAPASPYEDKVEVPYKLEGQNES